MGLSRLKHAAGDIEDGADVAEGSTTDAAWSGTGAGTVVSILKKIASGGGSAVSIADGADVAQGSIADIAWAGSGSGTVVAILKKAVGLLAGTLTVDASGHTVPVSGTVGLAAGTQVVGHVIVDTAPSTAVTGPLTDTQLRASAVPVSGTFFQGTQPVSLATNTPDVTDRTARLLGHVTVDSAPSTAVTNTGTFAVQSSATIAVDSVGLAKDSSLTTIFGSPTTDSPGAYTVLDQLSRIRKAEEVNTKVLQALLTAATPTVARKTQPTLLHRS